MKRYVKAVLGGVLAILAAFGWMVTLVFFLLGPHRVTGSVSPQGIGIFLAIVLPIFAAGFYLAFRAAYSKNSN